MTTNAPRNFDDTEPLSKLITAPTPAPPPMRQEACYSHLQHLETLVSEAVADIAVNGTLSQMMLDRLQLASLQRITKGNDYKMIAESIRRMRSM